MECQRVESDTGRGPAYCAGGPAEQGLAALQGRGGGFPAGLGEAAWDMSQLSPSRM